MNDDYDDPDEPGGLWDPDAISAPPARPRTVLHAVPQPDATEPEPRADETLVRLDQFRPIAAGDEPPRAPLARRWLYGAAAVAATAVLGAGTLVLTAGHNHGATPPVATFSGPDAEQTALGRIVAPRSAKRDDAPRAKDRRAKVAHRSSRPTRVSRAVQKPFPAAQASTRQVATTTTQARSGTATGAHAAANSTVAPASSNDPEFGFER
jgi:hypothetical protein